MSGKRSRSFKCAVHRIDREVSSLTDFHLLIEEKPSVFNRMVRMIAEELIAEERDRKYYADHYTCWPPPLFIPILTIIQLIVFLYYTVITGEMQFGGPVPLDCPFIYRPDARSQVWRYLLFCLLHTSWLHLAFNLLVQAILGVTLEMVHGSARIATIYVAGVLAGSLGTSVIDSDVYLVGASGGVYALLAAHLANVLINHPNMNTHFAAVKVVGIIILTSFDMARAIYDTYAKHSSGLPVSYLAHILGGLAGLTIGLVVLKNFAQRLHDQVYWWVCLGFYLSFVMFAILYNVFHPYPYKGLTNHVLPGS